MRDKCGHVAFKFMFMGGLASGTRGKLCSVTQMCREESQHARAISQDALDAIYKSSVCEHKRGRTRFCTVYKKFILPRALRPNVSGLRLQGSQNLRSSYFGGKQDKLNDALFLSQVTLQLHIAM
jgi:hypothetical protein